MTRHTSVTLPTGRMVGRTLAVTVMTSPALGRAGGGKVLLTELTSGPRSAVPRPLVAPGEGDVK